MGRTYTIVKDDTLRKISKAFYGAPELYKKLADYNGILYPDKIIVGQVIEVPSRAELLGGPPAPAAAGPATPNGLEQVLSTFGDIYGYIREDGQLDPRWEADQLARAQLPFPLKLSWDPSKSVTKLYCHNKLVPVFVDVFETIAEEGLKGKVRTFGGCYNFRPKRAGGKLSTHCWGIAIDINPETNQMGSKGDMDEGVVEVFRSLGFKWGGDWTGKGKDPMHFQYCTGY